MTARSLPDERRPTETFPIPARGLIRTARGFRRTVLGLLSELGRRVYYAIALGRALGEPRTWGGETVRQMYYMGVGSLPLVVIVAGFLGAVTAFQTFYQLFGGVQNSVVGLISRQSIVLELGPLLTGLTLTGRVGARMTAEIGTMRVTEQIDALETLAYDPVAFLGLPRVLAALVMLPVLTMIADVVAILSAWATLVLATDVTSSEFVDGLRLAFTPFQVVYSMIKALCYGAAISFVCSFEGYTTTAGAEGVGRATAKAVVIASVAILVLDAVVAAIFAPLIQA
ncbi:MAG TPA: ABC transporter permease [Gemmatimonadaceae bacterium]|nr:ABC transporter permease [Gemmatimonadaceae bacterium]